MTLAKAIALSSGNKAQTHTDTGCLIVVQERYSDLNIQRWLHVWHMRGSEVYDGDITLPPVKLKTVYEVDPDADYWSSV